MFRQQTASDNCTATCFHNALVALGEKTARQEIKKISVKEVSKTIHLKKDLVLNPKYIVPAFNNHFKNKGLRAESRSGSKVTFDDLSRILNKPNASPAIVTVPARFFEIYGVKVDPDPIIAGSPFSYYHDILVLAIDEKVWFYDPMADRPNLSRARTDPRGQVSMPLFLELWGSTKDPNSFIWIETVPPGPIDKYLTQERTA
jgi:hypothetical protein